jgi:hypothetical protein
MNGSFIMPVDLITATAEDFEPLLKQTLKVETEHGSLNLVLDNIKINETLVPRDSHVEIDNRTYPPRKPFSLTLEGPREPILPSQMYKVTHPEIGEMHIFISAFRQDQSCMLYESTFN